MRIIPKKGAADPLGSAIVWYGGSSCGSSSSIPLAETKPKGPENRVQPGLLKDRKRGQ